MELHQQPVERGVIVYGVVRLQTNLHRLLAILEILLVSVRRFHVASLLDQFSLKPNLSAAFFSRLLTSASLIQLHTHTERCTRTLTLRFSSAMDRFKHSNMSLQTSELQHVTSDKRTQPNFRQAYFFACAACACFSTRGF